MQSLLKQLQHAETERDVILKDLSRRIFEKFSKHYELWKQCVDCVANLDVLASLAEYARAQQVICVPELYEQSADKQPFIDIAEGYHPCAAADTFIPNGLILGTGATTAPLSILTGPNMGGKSTLMRQVGLLVVMSQIVSLISIVIFENCVYYSTSRARMCQPSIVAFRWSIVFLHAWVRRMTLWLGRAHFWLN